ncbi:Maf family protein [Amnibacterium soli]|uniref:Nucleoside triphosphate pyrophosphatase n=1 Tax=Amnibacterium soli TaxID=1282736 RepID=A0ABP8ZED7_9MICO
MRLVLASTSPARLALLRAAGIEPETVPPGVDEEAAVAALEAERGAALAPDELVQLLARLKAEAVAAMLGTTDALVLGGDSAFAFGGTTYGKPLEPAVALVRWHAQRGGTGVLHSGHHLIDLRSGDGFGETARASVRFAADLDDAELAAYVASGEPLAVAGAFTIDGLAGPFIEHVDGDPSTVVGLSLSTLRRLVRRTGTAWTDLWNRPAGA